MIHDRSPPNSPVRFYRTHSPASAREGISSTRRAQEASRVFHIGVAESSASDKSALPLLTITSGCSSHRTTERSPHEICARKSATSRNLLNTLVSIFKLASSGLYTHL